MRFSTKLRSAKVTHNIDFDVSSVEMSDEQRRIVTKLFDKAKNEEIDVDVEDPCVDGKCLASKLLTEDEFQKVRGLRMQLGSEISAEWIIIDFCIHPVRHRDLEVR